MKRILAVCVVLAMLLTPILALATDDAAAAVQAQIEAALKMFGYSTIEEALEVNNVKTPEELLKLALTGKVLPNPNPTATAGEPLAPIEERSFDGKVLATMEMMASAEEIKYFFQVSLGIPIADFLTFPTINEALLALKTGKVDTLLSMNASATMIAQQDSSFYVYMDPRLSDLADVALSMVVLKAKEELGLQLNEAIATLKTDGTLDALAGTLFGGAAPEGPTAPTEGEKLLVGVTGDIPPIDYVDAAGNPVGYNVTLMNRIGALLNRPVEFVLINKGAAVTAMLTGKIDILFWQEQALSDDIKAIIGTFSDQIFITDPYLSVSVAAIELADAE